MWTRRGSVGDEGTAKSAQGSRSQEGQSRKGPTRQRFGSYEFTRRVSMRRPSTHKVSPRFSFGGGCRGQHQGVPYLAALKDPRSSRNASSAALAESFASVNLDLASNWALWAACRLTERCWPFRAAFPLVSPFRTASLITPVSSHGGGGWALGFWSFGENGEAAPEGSWPEERSLRADPFGVLAGVRVSLLRREFRGWRRVILPRCLRISSTSCTSSGGFGFLLLMNWSRWRPREEDVKATPHHWHTLSFGAGYFGPGVPESDFVGVASAILAAGNGCVGTVCVVGGRDCGSSPSFRG